MGPPDLLRRYAALLPQATHVSAYGLTEAGGVISFNDLDDTTGPARRNLRCSVCRCRSARRRPGALAPLPPGERGEILIRGPTLFSGYYRDEQKTREVVTHDGWLRSGDLGALGSGGRIRYLGRLKDMLKVGGENVAAVEIESHLCTHPAIMAAQVIGVPDDAAAGGPCRVRRAACRRDAHRHDVIRHCLGRIAGFKVPRYVYFVSDWPLSATKIQKFRLRERVREADRIDLTQFRS